MITGASRGIGRAVAKRFATGGSRLILTYKDNLALAEEAAKQCLKLGAPDSLLLRLDLTNDLTLEEAVKAIRQKFGEIDILINNAGGLWSGPLERQNLSDIGLQIRTNLEGPIKLTSLLLPNIKEAIVNVGSTLSKIAKRNLTTYSASKFGLRGFTKALAKEHPELRVLLLNPGLTATSMGQASGVEPERVAEVIFAAASGELHVQSGADIDVPEYLGIGKKGLWRKVLRFFQR